MIAQLLQVYSMTNVYFAGRDSSVEIRTNMGWIIEKSGFDSRQRKET